MKKKLLFAEMSIDDMRNVNGGQEDDDNSVKIINFTNGHLYILGIKIF